MKMIEVDCKQYSKIFINPNQISALTEARNGSEIFLSSGEILEIYMSPSELRKMIEENA